jgi:hypothetical protein
MFTVLQLYYGALPAQLFHDKVVMLAQLQLRSTT